MKSTPRPNPIPDPDPLPPDPDPFPSPAPPMPDPQPYPSPPLRPTIPQLRGGEAFAVDFHGAIRPHKPEPTIRIREDTTRWLSFALLAATAAGMASVQTGWAQTLPGFNQPQNQSSPILTPANQASSAPTSGVPANVLTPSTTNQLAPNTGPTTSFGRPKVFGSAGQGLPGMRGGPPINGPVGAQDPTADYMRPPVVGPLFCDPAINIAC